MRLAPVAPETAVHVAEAAASLVAALSPKQRALATFDFASEERESWHYTAKPRLGLSRGDMGAEQLDAVEALMGSGLSETGLNTARAIIQHELILGRTESSEGVDRFDRTPDLYFFSIFGTPGGDEPWGWRVEGHHLSLNVTVAGGDVISVTPTFFGVNPAEVKHGPQKGLRILQAEEDLGRELFLSLGEGQRDLAVIYPGAPPDLITRASRRVEIASRVGLPAGRMTAEQRERLMALVNVYTGRMPADVGRAATRKLEGEAANDLLFGWAGNHDRGQGHYYRVHGPSIFIEYDNTQNMANHVHSVWRDIEGDFGSDILRDHYEQHHA